MKGIYRQQTMPVGSFPPNAWGLFDMHGNVYEWCSDWYGDYLPEGSGDPGDTGTSRVLRGGSWYGGPGFSRSACRGFAEPGSRDGHFGLRVLLCRD
jgi:formylglycine-generating enzyme required for sulfatase activity